MNSEYSKQRALSKLASFENAHPRGVVLLDEVNLWHSLSDMKEVLHPRLKHPGKRLVLSGANLPESDQLSKAIEPVAESSDILYQLVDYP